VVTPLLLALALAGAPAPHLGADLTVSRPTQGPVVSALGSVRVSSEVEGSVIALAGDVELAPQARVHGDVIALGGEVFGSGKVDGRLVSLVPLGLLPARAASRPSGTLDWALRCLKLGGWLIAGWLVLVVLPRRVRLAAEDLRDRPWRALAVGAVSVGVWLAAVILALGLAPSSLGVLLLALGVLVLLLAKLFGVLAVAWLGGRALRRVLPLALRGEVPRTGAALLVLALLGSLPVLGGPLWLLANVAGIGAAVSALLVPSRLTLAVPGLVSRLASR
jgi:hypothetical protein